MLPTTVSKFELIRGERERTESSCAWRKPIIPPKRKIKKENFTKTISFISCVAYVYSLNRSTINTQIVRHEHKHKVRACTTVYIGHCQIFYADWSCCICALLYLIIHILWPITILTFLNLRSSIRCNYIGLWRVNSTWSLSLQLRCSYWQTIKLILWNVSL